MLTADLHLHTYHSDGTRPPAEVVDRALAHRLDVMAISDHDNVAAIHEIAGYAASRGIRLIPAVELSTSFEGEDIHILGYGFDPASPILEGALEQFRSRRLERGSAMVSRLIALGYPIRHGRVAEIAAGGSLGRPHIARALIEAGSVVSVDEAFAKLLGPGLPGWVEVERIPTRDAIALVHEAGGIASLAHPTVVANHRALTERIIPLGLDAIEAFHPDVDSVSSADYVALASERGLLITGGSDEHGFEPEATMGRWRLGEPHLSALLERLGAG